MRFSHLGEQSYWMDEGYTVNAVDAGLRNGWNNGNAILDSGETYTCPLYCLPTAGLVALFGNDPAVYRVISALFGMIFIGVNSWIAWIFFHNKQVTLLTMLFTACSYWQIAWSRQARWYTMLEVFFWLALGLFYLFLKTTNTKRKIMFFWASICSAVLAIITHRLAYLLPVIMLAWYVMEMKPNKRGIAIGLGAMLAVLLFVEFVLDFHFIAHAIDKISLHYTLPYYLNFYLRNYFVFFFYAFFAYLYSDAEDKKKIVMLMLPFTLYLFCLSFFTNIVHYRYLFHAIPIIYSIGLVGLPHVNKTAKMLGKPTLMASFGLLLLLGHVVLWPKHVYQLESDDPNKFTRPYYAYTPQPDFNAAYGYINAHKADNDIIISSHPHFNKIYLNTAGYWLKYNYLGMEDTVTKITDDTEYYVGATVIDDLAELQSITQDKHGYVFFDYMSTDGRIPAETIAYIREHFTLVYSSNDIHLSVFDILPPYTNDLLPAYSQFWVYEF